MNLTGAEIIIRSLEHQGISYIAGIPGGSNLPLYDALSGSSITHILTRHEQGAGFIAQGMARAGNMPAVCFATSGPGATNLITALADAHMDGIAVIAITGQVPSPYIGTDAFQEVDIVSMAQKVTKKTYSVKNALDLLEIIPEAFSVSQSGKPGPVLIDVPKDIQLQRCCFDTWPQPKCCKLTDENSGVSFDKRIVEMITSARRPLIYFGGGVSRSGETTSLLLSIAEKLNIPMVSTLMGMGAIADSHPLFLGMAGMHGSAAANIIMSECDLLLAVGVRFGDRATGKVSEFVQNAAVIHVNIDPRESGKILSPYISCTLSAIVLLSAVHENIFKADYSEWMREIEWIQAENKVVHETTEGIHPYHILKTIGKCIDADAIITTDVGQHQMWVAQHYPFTGKGRFLTSGGLGTMGFGLPAAIGAAVANPTRQIICFSGDGSILMNIQELATLSELNCNVKIFIFNNNQLGMVRQQQDFFYKGNCMASQFIKNPDYVAIAKGFGIDAIGLTDDDLSEETIRLITASNGPKLIEVFIRGHLNVLPMVCPGEANTKMIRVN